jgi:hypothetical protein
MTYMLNTDWANQSVADRSCRSAGGILATYYTVREQVRGSCRHPCMHARMHTCRLGRMGHRRRPDCPGHHAAGHASMLHLRQQACLMHPWPAH